MRRLRRLDAGSESQCMAPFKMELAAEMGIARPRNGAVVQLQANEWIEFSRIEVDGIIDRCEQYRPREP